ncbi:MAG: PKD domain-containing protein, partial [Bradymonadaceae bacterium]
NTDTDVVTIDAVDQAPTADAGSDRSGVQIGSTVTLDGSNSSDPQGQTLSYQWSFASKPGASTTTITDATKATASFKPDVEGTYELSLQVTDPDGNSDTDKVTVGVVGPTPTADAGSKKTGVKVGETVSLDGSGSSDPQGQTLTYAWSFKSRPSGSTATITDASKVSASFQPDEPGTYKIKLTVTDPDGNTDSDKVTVKVVNQKPTADIAVSSADSAHGEYKKGTSVTLDGTGSSDPEGKSLTYSWTFANKPGSSTATIQSASSATASFTPDVVGTFEVKLVVKDQAGKKGSAKQTVPAVDDLKPTASIALTGGTSAHGEYKTGASITLDGTSSSDPEGGSLTYSWAFASKPNGSTSTIQSASSDTASLTPDVAGTYDIDLTVTDSAGNTHTASASVVAVDDLTPVADVAGSTSRTVTLQGGTATISLDGSASSDEEDMNSALTFAWDKKSGPGSVTYSAASSASTDATVSVAGTYELRLTVTDTSGNTDTVVVTVQVN